MQEKFDVFILPKFTWRLEIAFLFLHKCDNTMQLVHYYRLPLIDSCHHISVATMPVSTKNGVYFISISALVLAQLVKLYFKIRTVKPICEVILYTKYVKNTNLSHRLYYWSIKSHFKYQLDLSIFLLKHTFLKDIPFSTGFKSPNVGL